ncbi:MAG: hypothetical protein WC543_02040 [Candidatus Omnitrophota bacterium]
MKNSLRFILTITTCFLISVLWGCATVKEMGKGFAGISTKILEDGRPGALKKSFALDYQSCYSKVKDILTQKIVIDNIETTSYIYAEALDKKMIAIYLSQTDTTPVGIFFTEGSDGNTLIEVSSPSTYAKEVIADRIFSALTPKVAKMENITDVKEEVVN